MQKIWSNPVYSRPEGYSIHAKCPHSGAVLYTVGRARLLTGMRAPPDKVRQTALQVANHVRGVLAAFPDLQSGKYGLISGREHGLPHIHLECSLTPQTLEMESLLLINHGAAKDHFVFDFDT